MKKKNLALTILLAYILPGFGHIYLGEKKRGCIFFVAVILLFSLGWSVGGGVLWDEMNILTVLAYIVIFFNGLPFMAMIVDQFFSDSLIYYHEVGTTLMLIAGALNILVILNACDIYFEKARSQS
ncbi:MAG: hypothetical protein Q8Q33_06835 [Chlamydiota bacterium]|nr:hypothetical protein [Chlamydiota bacterium]